jgi:hypothetical protein
MKVPIAAFRSLTLVKVPAADGLTGDDPEEDFDHVQPGAAGRSKCSVTRSA